MRLIPIFLIGCALFTGLAPAQAQLRGHGGPVRALAVSADGAAALSGSFDTSAILWSLQRNAAEQVLRLHDGAVNAVAFLKDGRVVTAGADARIGIWTPGRPKPDTVLEGHGGPIVALAVSPDGATLASASWDHTIRLWPLTGGGAPRVLKGSEQNVNGVAFTPDGKVYFLSPAGQPRFALEATPTPVIALALSGNGERIAAASIGGSVAIIDRKTRLAARTLSVPGPPVWSAAFLPDNHTLLTGGGDRIIRRWDTETGDPVGDVASGGAEDPLAAYAGDPGAQVFRACVACHTLKPDDGNRAGPTLHGIIGRRIATLPGYNFSEALKHLDIVWNPETVSKLFELGPAVYTPGTKMPDQRIGAPEDRDALVKFLAKATQ
ncbi:MAG: c-type cytochrome [Stellaceae bacterium]